MPNRSVSSSINSLIVPYDTSVVRNVGTLAAHNASNRLMQSESVIGWPVILERKEKERDSTGEARATFLRLISTLRPQVITDLYATVYVEFVYAVADHFKHELLGDTSPTTSGAEAFLLIAKQVIEGIEAEHEPSVLSTLPEDTRISLVLPRVQMLNLHLQGRLSEPRLVEIVSLPLMRVILRIGDIGDGRIREAFSNWHALTQSTAPEPLRKSIQLWSTRWSLDEDRCRNHALRVLRLWLSDESLRWSYLPYISPDPRLFELWNFVAKKLVFDTSWSQVVLSNQIHGGDPKPFKARMRGVDFQFRGLNLISEKAADWKASVELEFRTQIYRMELSRLETLKGAGARCKRTELENKFNGILQRFEDRVNEYVAEMEEKLARARAKFELVEVREKRKLSEHFKWAVRFQIPTGTSEYESLAQIAESASVKPPGGTPRWRVDQHKSSVAGEIYQGQP